MSHAQRQFYQFLELFKFTKKNFKRSPAVKKVHFYSETRSPHLFCDLTAAQDTELLGSIVLEKSYGGKHAIETIDCWKSTLTWYELERLITDPLLAEGWEYGQTLGNMSTRKPGFCSRFGMCSLNNGQEAIDTIYFYIAPFNAHILQIRKHRYAAPTEEETEDSFQLEYEARLQEGLPSLQSLQGTALETFFRDAKCSEIGFHLEEHTFEEALEHYAAQLKSNDWTLLHEQRQDQYSPYQVVQIWQTRKQQLATLSATSNDYPKQMRLLLTLLEDTNVGGTSLIMSYPFDQ